MVLENRQQSKFDAKFKAMFETKDEKFQRLLKCLELLRENQIQIDSFTQQELLRFCILLDRMIKHVRVLTTIPYKDVRDGVLAKANSLGICPLNHEMNVRHIYEVCLWMKTKAGIEAVVEVQRTEKLKRRAIMKGRTLAEVSMVRAINAQFAEYSDEIKKAMKEAEFSTIRDKYWPSSTFHISNIVNEESVIEFCRKEGVKSRLIEYIKGLIGCKKMIYDRRKVEVLRVVLAGMEDGNHAAQASSCEGESSTMNGKKRRDATVLGYGEEPLSKTRKK